jgi:hypothetical protein
VTPTSKRVTRVTVREYQSRFMGSSPRRLVVTLSGDMILIRPKGTRRTEYCNILDVYERAVWSRVKSELVQKHNFKRRRRRTA